MRTWIAWLLAIVGVMVFLAFSTPVVQLIGSLIAIIPLAFIIGKSTEELAKHYSPFIGGLMNAIFGNIAELIIGIFAIKQGLVEIVKASLTGSIVGNLLFVFGTSVFISGFKYKEQSLNEQVSETNSTILMITMFLFLFPSMLWIFHEEQYSSQISFYTAIIMLLLYLASLFFSFFTHKEWFLTSSHEKPVVSKARAFAELMFAVVVLSLISEPFTHLLEEIAIKYGMSDVFIGAVIVGFVGNIAEHLGAIVFSLKNKVDIVIGATIGSSIQIALFVAPVLVLTSMAFGNEMTLTFLPVEITAILSSVLLINEISRDKKVNWLEGLELILLYVMIAVVFFYSK